MDHMNKNELSSETQEREVAKRNRWSEILSIKLTVIICLFFATVIVVASLVRDHVRGRACTVDPIDTDLSLECLTRPLETVLKNVNGAECRCQDNYDCTTHGCHIEPNGAASCCHTPYQQCILFSADGKKKAGCCVKDPKEAGRFLCNPNSKNCTIQCAKGTVDGSGCRDGLTRKCCEYAENEDGRGWCSKIGPCAPCLYGTSKVGELAPCTNAEGSNTADACCYEGGCLPKSCPKSCKIRGLPANEGQVCSPANELPGTGCCNNGTCILIRDPAGTCPSPCRRLSGTVVADGRTCATLQGTADGICVKGHCEANFTVQAPVPGNVTTPTILGV